MFPPAVYYLPPPETIAAEAQREQRGHFNIVDIETGLKADVYPTGRDELNAWAFRLRRAARKIPSLPVQFPELARPNTVHSRKDFARMQTNLWPTGCRQHQD